MKNLLTPLWVVLLVVSCSKEKADETNNGNKNENRLKATTLSVPSQYSTIQAAINAANSGDVINIANGTYNEIVNIPSTKSNIKIIGASQTGVILTASGTTQTTLTVDGSDITFETMTIRQTAGQTAGNTNHAVRVNGARVEFYKCYLYGWQDTFCIYNNALVYCNLCEIRGSVDFIYGDRPAFFQSCNIRQMRVSNPAGGVNAAPNHASNVRGFVFSGCTICRASGVPDNSSTLMRPWGANGETAYINCSMDSHISAAGWSIWSTATPNTSACRAAEYGSKTLSGTAINLSTRSSWVTRLTSTSNYTRSAILGSWTPPL